MKGTSAWLKVSSFRFQVSRFRFSSFKIQVSSKKILKTLCLEDFFILS